jgi:flagellar FliL protein
MSKAATAEVPTEDAPKKKGKLGLVAGLVLAVLLGGGAFQAVRSGMIDPLAMLGGDAVKGDAAAHGGGHGGGGHGEGGGATFAGNVAFVPMEPIMISLQPGRPAKLLRFTGQLEVEPVHAAEVVALMPRVLDVLNTYLRAVEVQDLEEPAAMARLRAQMLRRVQVVTGEGLVRDLLVTEFVLN